MPFPTTLDELREQGYRFNGEGPCSRCGARMEWYITPNGKKMPMDVSPDGKTVTSHWSTCKFADEFKRKKA